jgi:hypothetical protein
VADGLMENSYCFSKDDKWFCLLPSRTYREIPYINWVEDINWQIVYYKLFNAIMRDEVSCDDLLNMPLQDLLAKIEIYV